MVLNFQLDLLIDVEDMLFAEQQNMISISERVELFTDRKKISDTGNRTRAVPVKAGNPNP